MQLKDYCSITVEGKNLYVFINAVRQSAIICIEQHCTHNVFCCQVRRTDLNAFQHLADTHGMTLEIEKKKSIQGIFRRYHLRFGLTAGMLIGACVIFWQSNVVETIEVQGNSGVSTDAILNVLEKEGVSYGTWIAEIDMTHCEHTVRSMIPDIAWCGIRHTGNRLVVEVTEITQPPDMLQERTPCNIVSQYDAQITDVEVYSGHLQRMIGDGVAAGDLLVSGIHEGVNGQTTFRHALASITGIYTQEIELTEYFQNSETAPTGRSTTQQWLRLFGLKIPLGFNKITYAEYKIAETTTDFSFLTFRLPCGIVRRTVTETQTTTVNHTPEETELALNAAIMRYEKNLLSDVTILDRQLTFSETADGITCHLCYTVEGEIGKTTEFFIR